MSVPIHPITAPVLAQVPAAAKPSDTSGDFASMLTGALGNMDQSTRLSGQTVDKFLSGENEEVHDMVLATQRTELQFELFLQVRNKMVQAYQEVMRMQM